MLLLSPLCATAQQYFDPGLFQQTVEQKPEDFQAPGARLGSFMLTPGAEIAWERNDNVFYTPNNGLSDSIWHVRPWANLHCRVPPPRRRSFLAPFPCGEHEGGLARLHVSRR